MRRRLLISTALIALAAVLVLGVPLGVVGGRLLTQRTEQRLEREADAAAGVLAQRLAARQPIDRAVVAALAAPGHRLDVVLPDGRRVSGGARLDGRVTRVRAGERAAVAVTAVAPGHERTEDIGAVWLAVLVLSLIAVSVAVALALVQGRRLVRPLERLAEQASGIGAAGGDAAHRASGVGEVDRVSRTLAEADQRVADTLRREREFSANVSHQLRSPLTGLRLRLEGLAGEAGTPEARDDAQAALAQADRLMATIEGLERLARSHGDAADAVDLARLAAGHVDGAWRSRLTAAGRPVTVEPAAGVFGRLDAEDARQVLDVLLDNALHHGEGAVRVELEVDAGWVHIAVEDQGDGVPEAGERRVFERRWSGGGGSGIGLALARELVRQAGGELRLARARPPRFEAIVRAARPGSTAPLTVRDRNDQ